jgi:hypothetical protein
MLSLCTSCRRMVRVDVYCTLTSELHADDEWPASYPSHPLLLWGEIITGTHWIGDWLVPRGGVDILEKRRILPLTKIKSQIIQPIDWPQHQLIIKWKWIWKVCHYRWSFSKLWPWVDGYIFESILFFSVLWAVSNMNSCRNGHSYFFIRKTCASWD